MGIILLILLVILMFGTLPRHGWSANWGYAPSTVLGLLLIGVIALAIIGSIPWGFGGHYYYAARPVTVINPAPVQVQPRTVTVIQQGAQPPSP